jgi:outer membrane beta-barrel protein
MIRNHCAILILSTLLLTSSALAAVQEGNASFSVFAGSFMFDSAEKLDDGPVIGARLGYDLSRNVGIEASFGFIDSRNNSVANKPQTYGYTYRTDLFYNLMPESAFVPFLTAGAGILNINGSELWGNKTSTILEYGIGARYFIADNLALRADARNLLTFDNNRHSNFEFTGGINYYFNKAKSAAVPAEVMTTARVQLTVSEPIKVSIIPAAQTTSPAPAAAPVVAPKPAVAAPPVVVAPLPKTDPPKPAASEPTAVVTAKPSPAVAAACTTAKKITRIVTAADGFEIVADAPLAIPRAITLGSPTRLALDIDCAVNGSGSKTLKVNHSGVTSVRIGNHPGSLRVVFDFNESPAPSYRVEKSSNGLRVIFGKR